MKIRRQTKWSGLSTLTVDVVANGYTVNVSGDDHFGKYRSETMYLPTIDDVLADIKKTLSTVQEPYLPRVEDSGEAIEKPGRSS